MRTAMEWGKYSSRGPVRGDGRGGRGLTGAGRRRRGAAAGTGTGTGCRKAQVRERLQG